MPSDTRDLLDAIVSNLVIIDEQKDIDLNAAASESGGEIDAEKNAARQRETERADALAPAFDAGIRSAWNARTAGNADIALDDRNPDENAMADALIQYLVSFDLAESSSVETEQYHYIYTITVAWDRLDAMAASAGLDLGEMLSGEGNDR